MPKIYLSPSTQEYNQYIIGGSEEYYMNLIADAMIPFLRASEINFTRNDPGDTVDQVVARSNAENFDLHLAIHSNNAPENFSGMLQGPDIYYYTHSTSGKDAATIFADNLKVIYPNPDLITSIPYTILAELRKTRAVSVLVELGYHDNYADAMWITGNIGLIARNLALSVTEYLGVPFVNPY